jgi:hypothetical protein
MKLYVVRDDLSQVLMVATRPPAESSGRVYEIDVRYGIIMGIKSGGVSYNCLRLDSGGSIQLSLPLDLNKIFNIDA